MAIVVCLFGLSIAVATFIENDFGSAAARSFVYNARWFELLLLAGMINLTGSILIRKLYRKQTFTIFLFHLSFVFILIGAAITRFTGFEATMPIREGETKAQIITLNSYLRVILDENGYSTERTFPAEWDGLKRTRFTESVSGKSNTCQLQLAEFLPNAEPVLIPSPSGPPAIEIVTGGTEGRMVSHLQPGDGVEMGGLRFAFGGETGDSSGVVFQASGDSLKFLAPFAVSRSNMADQTVVNLKANTWHPVSLMNLYNFRNLSLVVRNYLPSAIIGAVRANKNAGETSAAKLIITSENRSQEAWVFGKPGETGEPVRLRFDNHELTIQYGSIEKEIPFELTLNDFILERYPGSNSPSWFESAVTLTDSEMGISKPVRIYMNHILKHRGYRFYQASYTPNEKGTILSVNRDWAGTWVSYSGYFLMGAGMLLSLFNRRSRFQSLIRENSDLRSSVPISVFLFVFLIPSLSAGAQQEQRMNLKVVDQNHAAAFGRLLVQDRAGRIEPVNTLSAEVLRKLYRKYEYKGLTPDQVLLGMLSDPEAWQNEPVFRGTHPQILNLMGTRERYHTFVSFFRGNQYILQQAVESAYRKKPALRSKFDNEVIRLDERVNIGYMIFTGELLRLFPVMGDSNNTWYSAGAIAGRVTGPDSLVTRLLPFYLQEVRSSLLTGKWENTDEILEAISVYQNKTAPDLIPSHSKVKLELILNQTDVFARISKGYLLVGGVLLLIQFTGLFYRKLKVKLPVNISKLLIILFFILHSAGLAARWYVSGHAPWSNGYEALTYIAWATVLAGLMFSRRSGITLSATAIMAYLILHTAHLSWMDPQITNLVPVLKSYWLVIHVATITASYGFLALGALLAAINLVLMVLMSSKNREYIQLTLRELGNIIEMNLIIGLYLLTIGTFLGGVWANESWGRYWGWDPKETWALVTILVYAFVAHMRLVPGLKGLFAFNLASLLGFSSVIMTYFGVNYYLSGLHSYAKGDPLPIPAFVYYTVVVIFLLAVLAYLNFKRIGPSSAKGNDQLN